MRQFLIASLLLAAGSTGAPAQPTQVRTETRVNLRRDPSTERTPRRVLRALELLDVTGAEQNGFLPVRTSRDEAGWVSREYVFSESDQPDSLLLSTARRLRVIGLDAPAVSISPDWERPPVGKSTMRREPDDGTRCGPRGGAGGDWETFVLKNRNDYPTVSYAVTFDALEELPYKDGGLAKDRTGDQWTREQKREVGRYEGIPLTITGFLAAVKPQGGSAEATNCRFKGEANTDWHVALVAGYRDGEDVSLVVEPTPRFKRRHPNWTKANLTEWTGDRRSRTDSVRVTGFLFYDPDHANHLGRYRATMWELHPVTRIELFRNGTWVDLDDQ